MIDLKKKMLTTKKFDNQGFRMVFHFVYKSIYS